MTPSFPWQRALLLATACTALALPLAIPAQTTAFTYQGVLTDSGAPANGHYDLTFSLYDAPTAGNQQGGPFPGSGTVVSNGLFTATVDFGSAAFGAGPRWIEVGVRTNGNTGAFATLAPRTAVTSVPYAINASTAQAYAGPISITQLPSDVARVDASQNFTAHSTFAGGLLLSGPDNNFPLTITANDGTNNNLLGFEDSNGVLRWHLTDVLGGLNFVESSVADFRLFLQPGGNVGVGTSSPDTLLQVGSYYGGDTYATVASSGGNVHSTGIKLRHYDSTYGWTLESHEEDSSFRIYSHFNDPNGVIRLYMDRFSGNVGIGVTNPATMLSVGGDITCTAINLTSDRNAKTGFNGIEPGDILDKVVQLPISEWSYKEQPATRHIGPMAQDFHAAFAVGLDEKHISPIDEDGVALAAIQGLNAKLEQKLAEKDMALAHLRAENQALAQRLEKLERLAGLPGQAENPVR